MIKFLLGFILGGAIGMLIMGLIIAGKEDEKMTNEEIIVELNKIMKHLESVDFMSHEKHTLRNNQIQIHNTFNAIDNLIKKLKEQEQEMTRGKGNKRRYYFVDKGLPKRKIELFNVEVDIDRKEFSGYDKDNVFYKLRFSDTDLIIEEVK